MDNKKRYTSLVLLLLLLLLPVATMAAGKKKTNSQQAREIFDRSYNLVFGPQGSTLAYSVNIMSLYKTAGTIAIKGKKSCFTEQRYLGWRDEKNYWMVDKKKKEVELHNVKSPKSDKYASKVTYSLSDFNYSLSQDKQNYIITLNARKDVKGVKHAKVYIDKQTRAPRQVKVKVMFFWANVKISNFRVGIPNESIFTFPRQRFKNYKFTDKRPD